MRSKLTVPALLLAALFAVLVTVRTAAAAPEHLDRSILEDPSRPDADREQDAGRKALDVYEWLGIGPGMTVADVFAAGGYNTHLLSHVVGPKGKVFSVAEFYANKELYDGRLYQVDKVEERIRKGGLSNVTLVTHIADLKPASVDAMVIIRNYHDVEWVFSDLKRKDVVAALERALKPGGVIGVVDVATPEPGWDEKAHRLNEKVIIDDFTSGGFELSGRSDMLANPNDDHKTSGFKEGRYKLDRYLLKFTKPGGKR